MTQRKINAWTPEHFRKVLTKAGKIISCSFGVIGGRSKKTGRMATILLFHDDDKDEFAYAFEFESTTEVRALCEALATMAKRIESGEFSE